MNVSAVVFCLVVFTAYEARGGGQFVGESGSQPMQRGGAFVAKADDPTALLHNPAALVWGNATELFVGANVVHFDQSFERHGTYQTEAGSEQPGYVGDEYPTVSHEGPVQPVPFLAAGIPLGRWAIGVGVFAPQGYPRRNFPDEIGDAGAPAPQRYDTVYQKAQMVLPSAAVAVRVHERLALGVRASYGVFSLESRRFVQGLSNAGEDPGQDSDVTLQASDKQIITFGAGIHYRHSPQFEAGASYTAPIAINAVGTSSTTLGPSLREPAPGQEVTIEPVPDELAQCRAGGTADAIAACVDFRLPQTASVGVRWIARDEGGAEIGDVEFDFKWENWSAVSNYRIRVDAQNSLLMTPLEETVVRHGFRDVFSVRVGGAAQLRGGKTRVELRGGVAYDSAAAPTSWTRLDVDGSDRITAAAGLGVSFGRFRLDVGAAYVDSPQRNFRDVAMDPETAMDERVQPDVGVPLETADAQPYHPFNAGTYQTRYVIGSVGLAAGF